MLLSCYKVKVTEDGKDDEPGEHRGAGVGDGYDQRVPVDVVRELQPDSIGFVVHFWTSKPSLLLSNMRLKVFFEIRS